MVLYMFNYNTIYKIDENKIDVNEVYELNIYQKNKKYILICRDLYNNTIYGRYLYFNKPRCIIKELNNILYKQTIRPHKIIIPLNNSLNDIFLNKRIREYIKQNEITQMFCIELDDILKNKYLNNKIKNTEIKSQYDLDKFILTQN